MIQGVVFTLYSLWNSPELMFAISFFNPLPAFFFFFFCECIFLSFLLYLTHTHTHTHRRKKKKLNSIIGAINDAGLNPERRGFLVYRTNTMRERGPSLLSEQLSLEVQFAKHVPPPPIVESESPFSVGSWNLKSNEEWGINSYSGTKVKLDSPAVCIYNKLQYHPWAQKVAPRPLFQLKLTPQ